MSANAVSGRYVKVYVDGVRVFSRRPDRKDGIWGFSGFPTTVVHHVTSSDPKVRFAVDGEQDMSISESFDIASFYGVCPYVSEGRIGLLGLARRFDGTYMQNVSVETNMDIRAVPDDVMLVLRSDPYVTGWFIENVRRFWDTSVESPSESPWVSYVAAVPQGQGRTMMVCYCWRKGNPESQLVNRWWLEDPDKPDLNDPWSVIVVRPLDPQ